MKYFLLDPEVAGGLGKNSKLDTSVHPPRVLRLHYEVDAWLGDDLVQSFPSYLVARRMWERLGSLKPTGVATAAAEITASDEFRELNPGRVVPQFVWLKVSGAPGKDDFGLTANAGLVVSERVLKEMKSGQLEHCDVSAFG